MVNQSFLYKTQRQRIDAVPFAALFIRAVALVNGKTRINLKKAFCLQNNMESWIGLIYAVDKPKVDKPDDTVTNEAGIIIPGPLHRAYKKAEQLEPSGTTGCRITVHPHQLNGHDKGEFYVVISHQGVAVGLGGLEKVMAEDMRTVMANMGVPAKVEVSDKAGYNAARLALNQVNHSLEGVSWLTGLYVEKLMPMMPSGNYRNVTAAVVPA